MTEIQPAASWNWVRLLTMSTHPNQIQTDRFLSIVSCTYTAHHKQQTDERRSTRIDKNLKEINKITQIHPTASQGQILGKTQWNKWRRIYNPGSRLTCTTTSVIHGPGFEHWWQIFLTQLLHKGVIIIQSCSEASTLRYKFLIIYLVIYINNTNLEIKNPNW